MMNDPIDALLSECSFLTSIPALHDGNMINKSLTATDSLDDTTASSTQSFEGLLAMASASSADQPQELPSLLNDGQDLLMRTFSLISNSTVTPTATESSHEEDFNDQDDYGDEVSKIEKRKQRNRESAARSRKRSRERMVYLENLVDHLTKKNRRLQQAVQYLTIKQASEDRTMNTELFSLANAATPVTTAALTGFPAVTVPTAAIGAADGRSGSSFDAATLGY